MTDDSGTMETAVTNDDAASSTTAPLPPAAEAVKTAGQEGPRAWPKPSKVAGSAQGHRRTSSFQRWMHQMQSTWTSVPAKQEPAKRSTFNPEVLVNQKRQWYQLQSRTLDRKQQAEPTSLFEQFFIVGLRSDANVDAVEDGFAKRKTWELEMEKSEILDLRKLQYGGPPPPTLEPQILFKYPRRKRIGMRVNDLPAFCFPGGVKARLMERTPSMSDLNEVVYGQEHMSRDDLSFIFSLKVADNSTLYGVCLHVQEIVQRAPGILGVFSPLPRSSGGCSRFLVSAPRCYCILTKVPFFELHYEMLNSIIAEERLERITQFANEMALRDLDPPAGTQVEMDENLETHKRQVSADWMASAIPVDSILSLHGASPGPPLDKEVPQDVHRQLELQSPESLSASEALEFIQAREQDRESRKSRQYNDDLYTSEISEFFFDSSEILNGSIENGLTSLEVGTCYPVSQTLEPVGSSESLMSSVRSMGSNDETDESKLEKNPTDEHIMIWAKENGNELLQIVCGYHALSLPPRGAEIVFQPLYHLQPIKYNRPGVSALGLSKIYTEASCSLDVAEVNAQLAAAEESVALSIWTTATVCRALSLESVLALFAGALLEKQVVVLCPNLGILSATVLSVIPMIRPFQWQSLMLPILPKKMLDFLDAPVPFIVGIHDKLVDMKMKTSNVVQINVRKDQVKTSALPRLPRHRDLVNELGPIHARLSCENAIAKRHPVYKCNEAQAEAAEQFLKVMRNYLESLCSDIRSHTITSVQSNNDRVSLLLKDSFVDSFPSRDRPFVKLLVETQLFTVLSDSRISKFEMSNCTEWSNQV